MNRERGVRRVLLRFMGIPESGPARVLRLSQRPAVIHSSLYLPEPIYEALRKIAFEERVKIMTAKPSTVCTLFDEMDSPPPAAAVVRRSVLNRHYQELSAHAASTSPSTHSKHKKGTGRAHHPEGSNFRSNPRFK